MSRANLQPSFREKLGAPVDPNDIENNLKLLGLLSDHPKSRSRKAKKKDAARVTDSNKKPSGSDHKGFRPSSRSSQLSLERGSLRGGIGGSQRHNSKTSLTDSIKPRSTRGMAGVLDLERSRTRRERTFIGAECAFCEELLEHTLRGERILQLSCGHVAHEACFYEYIKEFDTQECPTCNAPLGLDTSRGGNVLDLEKLGAIARQNQQRSETRSIQATTTPWDNQSNLTDRPSHSRQNTVQDPREVRSTASNMSRERQYGRQHMRNDSGATGVASSDYADTHNRRHDFDVQSMESSLTSPRSVVRNPIPPPMVTVRSEFPTITRSRQQQSITCLVTVEVVEGKWRPDPEDIRAAPPLPSNQNHDAYSRPKSPSKSHRYEPQFESSEALDEVTEDLHARVDNWHGLDVSRFGKLRLHGHVRVGKDKRSWQELECYLFTEMLICVKEKKVPQGHWDADKKPRCALKGSILIKKHLRHVQTSPEESILTLSLSVAELPSFHLQFTDPSRLELWRYALMDIHNVEPVRVDYDHENSGTDEDDYRMGKPKRVSSVNSSSYGATRSNVTAPTEYTNSRHGMTDSRIPPSFHIPLDIVVVIPVSSSMQGLKISLLRDALRFLVMNLGERDRMGLVTFGSSGGGVPVVGMTTKAWGGWNKVLESIRPVGQKSLRADVVEGANVAMDLLMQRKSANPLASILLISDSSTSEPDSVDFVVSRAEAAKVAVHSFGLGLTHKPDTMIELSTRTKASYTYVKDWWMLRECVAGVLGSLETTSHQNVKLKLRLPEGSPAKFVKISGALHITKRATGRDAEAALGDLRFGDKRDILVQLAIPPDTGSPEQLPQDAWETIVSGLEALGGPLDQDDQRTLSVEELPLLQADLTYGDILRDGSLAHLPRPSLLAITMLPPSSKTKSNGRPATPPIPPHPHVVQRRMELLTSDMLTRALTLVSRGQHERGHHLLSETRSILKGLGKGGLPPVPPAGARPSNSGHAPGGRSPTHSESPERREPTPPNENPFTPQTGIDSVTMRALDAELESSLEWINHPAVFGRDSRKAVLQAIGVISSQRGYTYRSPSESLWAGRIAGVKRLSERSKEWREAGEDPLMEEA